MKRLLILFLPFIFLVMYDAKVPEKEIVSYTILESNDVERLHYIGYKGPALEIISDNEKYSYFYLRMHIVEAPKPRPPFVDFTKNRVIFVSFNKSRSAAYSIKRLNVYIQNNILVVKTELSPPEYGFISRAVMHHYILILVPKNGYSRVEWRDERGERLWKTLWTK